MLFGALVPPPAGETLTPPPLLRLPNLPPPPLDQYNVPILVDLGEDRLVSKITSQLVPVGERADLFPEIAQVHGDDGKNW